MVDDTGGPAPAGAGNPAGVVAGSGVAVTVRDPLVGTSQWRGNGVGHVYLFQRSGSLDPSAGADYVDYDFAPADPMGHAEDSRVSTDRYTTHFSAALDPRRDHPRHGPGHPRPPPQPLLGRELRAQ